MLFNAAHTLEACMEEYPTHSGKVEKLKINILHLVGAKIFHKNVLHNAVPDLNESIEGSTDLKKKWHGSADCHTPLFTSLFQVGYHRSFEIFNIKVVFNLFTRRNQSLCYNHVLP